MKKKLFIIVGRSGSGKDTVMKKLIKQNPELNRVIPITTRPKRDNEKYGEDYFFISEEKMTKLIKNKELIEYRVYNIINKENKNDIWIYGHEKPTADNSIMIGTPSMVSYIKSTYYNDYLIYPICINADDETILLRIILREEENKTKNWRELVRRFFKDKEDFKSLLNGTVVDANYKYFINDDLNSCVKNITTYIKSKESEEI